MSANKEELDIIIEGSSKEFVGNNLGFDREQPGNSMIKLVLSLFHHENDPRN